jgi:hypothetical protein
MSAAHVTPSVSPSGEWGIWVPRGALWLWDSLQLHIWVLGSLSLLLQREWVKPASNMLCDLVQWFTTSMLGSALETLEQAHHPQPWVSSLLASWEFTSHLPFKSQHKVNGSCYFPWAMQDLHLWTQGQIHFKVWLQAEETWAAPDMVPVECCSFIPRICGDPTVDPSCPSESILHPLPSAWNTSTLVLFFPSSTRSILLTLEMSHHISFPTDTIFSVNSPSISTKPTRIPSYLPDMPSALHNHFYLSPLITRDLCIPLSFDDHKLTDLKEDSICLWP